MSDIRVGSMVLSPCATNCYYVYHEGSNECIVIDPADRGDYIYDSLKAKGLVVKNILITHGHFDHIWGCSKLRSMSEAPVYALDEEQDVLESSRLNVSEDAGRACTVKVSTYLHDMDVIELNGFKIQVLATPGHTHGSCCYYFISDGILFSGDTLFQGSVGRTDLPTGSMAKLHESLIGKLDALPNDTVVYPGHGDSTTIDYEKQYNPFWN